MPNCGCALCSFPHNLKKWWSSDMLLFEIPAQFISILYFWAFHLPFPLILVKWRYKGVGKSPPYQSISIVFIPILWISKGQTKQETMAPACEFDRLFTKKVPHIHEKIFFSLDYESFKNCVEVSKSWNDLLTSDNFLRRGKSVFFENI